MCELEDEVGSANGYYVVNFAKQQGGQWVAHSAFWRTADFRLRGRTAPAAFQGVPGTFASSREAFEAAREFAYRRAHEGIAGI
jgi:hypothetical protein